MFLLQGTDAIDGDGLIDGVSTFEIITLSGEQLISGPITFRKLEVTEEFHVTGKITGKHLDDFLANPSLVEANLIESACFFHHLTVNGPIIVADHLNGIELDTILADIIYKSNPTPPQCTSFKSFDTLLATDLRLSSDLLNGIPVETFLTVDTEQTLSIDHLSGTIMFEALHLSGLFDSVNVTELDANSIKLSGDQYTETELLFVNSDENEFQLIAEQLNVKQIINGIRLTDCIRTDQPVEFRSNWQLDEAIIDELFIVNGAMTGDGGGATINGGMTLLDLDANRLSLTRPQDVNGSMWLQSADVMHAFDAVQVNDYPSEQFRNLVGHIEKFDEFLRVADDVQLQKLLVDGSAVIGRINGHEMEAIINNAIWLTRPNEISGNLNFLNPLSANDVMVDGSVNKEVIQTFIDGLVQRNRLDDLVFTEVATFPNGFVVEQIDADYIGTVKSSSILRRNMPASIPNDVLLRGNLYVKDLRIFGAVNGGAQRIFDVYNFDAEQQLHCLKCNAVFKGGPIQTGSLQLAAVNDGIDQFDAFLQSIVRKDSSDRTVHGKKVFKGTVEFVKDVTIERLNGVSVRDVLTRIVLNVPGDDVVEIQGDVAFTGEVTADRLHVRGDVLASSLMGCNVGDWLRESIRIDENVEFTEMKSFSVGSFVAANVDALYVNGAAMQDVITKHTPQNLTGMQHFSKVYSSKAILVNGKVNGLDLRVERENTVMVRKIKKK